MRIRVDEVKDTIRELSSLEEVSEYPALAAMVDSGECRFLVPIGINLKVVREYGHIRATGTVSSSVSLVCSRCLVEFEQDITSNFTLFYIPSAGVPQDEEVELDEQDLISVPLEGDEIDFSPEIAEQVLLEIPFKPLCKEVCQGLCPHCGIDLNEKVCDCNDEQKPLTFSMLKDVRIVT
jgi:DUF177 domain-containing protein